MLKKCKKDKYDVMNQLIYIEFKYSAKSQIKNRLKEKMQIYLSQNFKSYKFIYLVSSLFDCLLSSLYQLVLPSPILSNETSSIKHLPINESLLRLKMV